MAVRVLLKATEVQLGRFVVMLVKFMGAALLTIALGGCGGGGSGGPAFTPAPPTPKPTPAPSASTVTIFADPKVGKYAAVGAWANQGDPAKAEERITTIVSVAANQPQIRYTEAGAYEVTFPGAAPGLLDHLAGGEGPDNSSFTVGKRGSFNITKSRLAGYDYSELAYWANPDNDFGYTLDQGAVAFGTATPTGSVPVTGSATFDGVIAGTTDAKLPDGDGYWYARDAGGTVTLSFDFASGTLGGEMHLLVGGDGMNPIDVGTYSFTQTVFGVGSTGYSGRFDTAITGINFFQGIFTGPNAQETIGSWAVPFQLDGADHQALGAWIAKLGQ